MSDDQLFFSHYIFFVYIFNQSDFRCAWSRFLLFSKKHSFIWSVENPEISIFYEKIFITRGLEKKFINNNESYDSYDDEHSNHMNIYINEYRTILWLSSVEWMFFFNYILKCMILKLIDVFFRNGST